MAVDVSVFSEPIEVFSWDKLDPPCLDPYNPAAVLYPSDPVIPPFSRSSSLSSVSDSAFVIPDVYLLFPAYTFHLVNTTTPFVNPYTELYPIYFMLHYFYYNLSIGRFGHNDNLLDIHFIFSHNGINFSYVTKEPFISRGIGYRNLTSGLYIILELNFLFSLYILYFFYF